MRRALLAAALLLSAMSASLAAGDGHGSAPAPTEDAAEETPAAPLVFEPVGEPVKLVRTLQFLQDEIAHGPSEPGDARTAMLAHIGETLLAAGPSTWSDRRNVDAALLYVLSGGNPAVLTRLDAAADTFRTQLIKAIAAYSYGSRPEAETLWAAIDINALPIPLAGPAALVKANLLAESDPAQALRFADVARLESPGTLIEEAAIRRSIDIAAKLGDETKFQFYVVRYATRFPRSTYESVFRRRFAESYLGLIAKDAAAPDAEAKLEEIVAPLAGADRRAIYLEVAKRAVIEVRMDLARATAEKALALAAPGSPEHHRGELYRAAAMAISANPGDARQVLRLIAPQTLEADDRALRDALIVMLDRIPVWPGASDAPAPAQEIAGASPVPAYDDITGGARNAMQAATLAMQALDP